MQSAFGWGYILFTDKVPSSIKIACIVEIIKCPTQIRANYRFWLRYSSEVFLAVWRLVASSPWTWLKPQSKSVVNNTLPLTRWKWWSLFTRKGEFWSFTKDTTQRLCDRLCTGRADWEATDTCTTGTNRQKALFRW